MFRNPVNVAFTPPIHDNSGLHQPDPDRLGANASNISDPDPKATTATSILTTATTRQPAKMTSEAMERTLRSRNISLHGAHIFFVDIPEIMALAAAYATDRITRQLFIKTLNLFVQHARATSGTPRALTAAHLVSLGIPERDAKRLPLMQTNLDIWIVAGLFNGVMEMDDFDQLQNTGRKGEFWERNFGSATKRNEGSTPHPSDDDGTFISWEVLTYIGDYDDDEPQFEIKPACERLEKGTPEYDAEIHYALLLEAAARQDQRPNVMGPYLRDNAMKKAFYSIFRIVDPDYPGTTLAGLDAFTFSEPPPSPPPPMPIPKQTTSTKSSTKDCRSRPFCTLV